MAIERATDRDLPEVLALLGELNLPQDDVAARVSTMVVARENGHVVGTAAIEMYADGALLRSVAVARGAQGQGPESVQASVEFQSACPRSATVTRKRMALVR